MIPDHRLASLLDQVKHNQIAACTYHNPTTSLSLFLDHICDRSQFPLCAIHELSQSNEVYFLEFSHNGERLATSGKEHACVVYETISFTVVYTLSGHQGPVAYITWSPDDTKLITCSSDSKARVWDAIVSLPTIPDLMQRVTIPDWRQHPSGRPPRRTSHFGRLDSR